MRDIARAIGCLDAYLNSWTDESGGVHGYIIHHHRDYAVVTAPACWTQGVRILGHLELYKKTTEARWLEAAELESNYLAQAYCKMEHLYHDSTTPLTLINNAWPTLALIKTATTMRERSRSGWTELMKVATDNLERRMISEHWDENKRTFYFCPVGYPAKRVHTYNQTAIAISTLCAMGAFSGDNRLVESYAMPAADHMIQMQDRSGPLRGGWGYNDEDSAHLYYYLYTALNLRGLLDLYEYTGKERFLESAGLAGEHLVSMIDPNTRLFSHRYVKTRKGAKRYPFPTMIATSGLGLHQIRRLNGQGFKFDVADNIRTLLDMQLPHGGFPNFIGSTDIWTPWLYPCEPEKKKWRDVVSVPFWNVFTFELLVDLLEGGKSIPEVKVKFPMNTDCDDGFCVEEGESYIRILRRANHRTVSYFDKKRDFLLFSTEKMRGVPFGAFANTEYATIRKLKRRINILVLAGFCALAAMLVSLLILF